MSPRRTTPALALIALCLALAACGAPTRTVSFAVHDAATGAPIPHAHVRAVPIAAGVVPLPVSLDTLDEFAYAIDRTGITDAQGRVTLPLYAPRPHHVEVIAAPVGSRAGEGPWAWVLSDDGLTLTPAPGSGQQTPAPVELSLIP